VETFNSLSEKCQLENDKPSFLDLLESSYLVKTWIKPLTPFLLPFTQILCFSKCTPCSACCCNRRKRILYKKAMDRYNEAVNPNAIMEMRYQLKNLIKVLLSERN